VCDPNWLECCEMERWGIQEEMHRRCLVERENCVLEDRGSVLVNEMHVDLFVARRTLPKRLCRG